MKKDKLSISFNFFKVMIYIIFTMMPSLLQAQHSKNSAVIFMYHKFDVSKYPSTNITLEQFESHLNEFNSNQYNILPLGVILNTIINDHKLPPNTIGITVDDANRSFLTTAWPRFKELNMPVTLFVSTKTIAPGNKNYLNWDEIRLLKKQGVTIGAHSHSHSHLPDLDSEKLKNEIEKSNMIFLKELGEIPDFFAYPYGEANTEIIKLLKNYKFKVAFGQHSGVVNEFSNFYYLPRFSLNEKYGDIDRVKFAANALGLGIYDFVPSNPQIRENPPFIGFSLVDLTLSNNLNCFVFDNNGQVDSDIFKFNERIEIRLKRKISKGRSRLNCTSKDENGKWRWFGHQFYLSKN